MITAGQLVMVFARYNERIRPIQVVAYLLGLAGAYRAMRPATHANRIASAGRTFLWLWVAFVFWIPIVEDIGMALGGVLGFWLNWRRDARAASARPEAPDEPASGGWSLDIPDKCLEASGVSILPKEVGEAENNIS
jgi:hypothetical protein